MHKHTLPTSTSVMAPDVRERGRGFSVRLTARPSGFSVSASLCSNVASLMCLSATDSHYMYMPTTRNHSPWCNSGSTKWL